MIGIFDSGYGGLMIMKEFLKKLPQYDYYYLGDNFRAPYGNRSQEAIYNFTHQAVEFLFNSGCELVILACNTASADALRKLQQNYLPIKYPNRRILGVIIPMAEAVAKLTKTNRVGVVGTSSTIESKTFVKEIKKQNETIEVFQQPCPLLVPLIEEGWKDQKETRMILKKYLRPLKNKKIDNLILGCTHYLLLLKEFKSILGKKIKIPPPGEIVADSLVDYLKRHPELETRLSKNKKITYATTGDPDQFSEQALKFLGYRIKAEKVDVDNFR